MFGKLQQGVKENQQFLTVARMRADAEELYGQHIGDIGPATDRIQDGFGKDEGASVRKVRSMVLFKKAMFDVISRPMIVFKAKCTTLPVCIPRLQPISGSSSSIPSANGATSMPQGYRILRTICKLESRHMTGRLKPLRSYEASISTNAV